ncbi:MAG: hypothetical protein HYS27_22745 [Deltaproteobacteria bacterium]|nr:hypothetical protein [Deltaproteobacteria bacterium]
MITSTPPRKNLPRSELRPVSVALLAALARLGVVAGAAAWLFVLLLNEIATALVYVLAAMLALFWSCGP